jgi:hypothetical protein
MKVSGKFHAPVALRPEERAPLPIGWELSESQSRSRRGNEDKKSRHFPCWELNPSRPAGNKSLYRLSYPNSCQYQYLSILIKI